VCTANPCMKALKHVESWRTGPVGISIPWLTVVDHLWGRVLRGLFERPLLPPRAVLLKSKGQRIRGQRLRRHRRLEDLSLTAVCLKSLNTLEQPLLVSAGRCQHPSTREPRSPHHHVACKTAASAVQAKCASRHNPPHLAAGRRGRDSSPTER
jgi:hypothetical protein